MNKLTHILSFVVLVFVLTSSGVYAQESLERDSFVIVKEYVPTLSQSSKIRINPVISDTHHLDLNLKYDFLDKKLESTFKPEPIKAATLKGEPLVKLYRSYLILGYGNNNTPLAELYFNQLRSKKLSYGLYGRHFSSNGISGIENSDFSNNAIGMNGNIYTRKYTYSGRFNYDYDQMNYYGYHDKLDSIDISQVEKNENVMQFYNRVNAALSFGNNQRDTIGIRHFSEISFNRVEDRYGASENRFIMKENLSALKQTEVYTFDWAIDYNKYSFSHETVSLDSNYENTMLFLEPGIELRGAKWKLDGALNVVWDFNPKWRMYLYPKVDFRYNLVKSIIIPYAGITGQLKRNTYAGLTNENPFVSPVLQLEHTSEKMTFYAGIGGHLSKNTSFDVSVTQSSFRDMVLFVKDTNSADLRSFVPIYDNVTMSKLTAELIYEPVERWNLVLKGDYFVYETTDELEAWHKPDYHVSVLAGYNLGNKILVKLMAYMIGGQKAKLYSAEESETLKGTADINLDFEYRYTKKLSLFLDLNNLTSTNYEKWQDYPTQRFNMMGGFKFSF